MKGLGTGLARAPYDLVNVILLMEESILYPNRSRSCGRRSLESHNLTLKPQIGCLFWSERGEEGTQRVTPSFCKSVLNSYHHFTYVSKYELHLYEL